MKSKYVLSVEQMKHLQELGLDTSDGSMCWCYALSYKNAKWELEIYEDVINEKRDSAFWEIIPTYTLQDILDKLPRYINDFGVMYKMCVEPLFSGPWAISYQRGISEPFIFKVAGNLLDVAYEMLCWCIENRYIKTNQL